MNLKESQAVINSLTVKRFTQLLAENEEILLKDMNVLDEIIKLKKVLSKSEDHKWEIRSKDSTSKLSEMTEIERKMVLMWPGEKNSFWSTRNNIRKIHGDI